MTKGEISDIGSKPKDGKLFWKQAGIRHSYQSGQSTLHGMTLWEVNTTERTQLGFYSGTGATKEDGPGRASHQMVTPGCSTEWLGEGLKVRGADNKDEPPEKAKLIVAFTESGTTASRVSRYRPSTKILALTPKEDVQRKLTLLWGVIPVTVEKLFNVDDFFNKALYESISNMNLKEKDLLILVAGLPIGVPGGTNLLRVMTVPSKK